MTSEIDWLDIDRRTLFVLTVDGRIERENDPGSFTGTTILVGHVQGGQPLRHSGRFAE